MKAVVYDTYGPPDVLELRDVADPVAGDDEVLVRIHASSINSWDFDLVRGTPLLNRSGGLRRPRYSILGADIAGRVEAVGADVTDFRRGDAVYGDISRSGWGGFAELVAVPAEVLAPKPEGTGFAEAAAAPQAGVLALQGLRYGNGVQPGGHVLVNGAGGGVGTFAVQIARAYGCEVTGVDFGSKLAMVRSIGADHVIDHTREDVVRGASRYDFVLDTSCHRSPFELRRGLTCDGTYVMIGGSTLRLLQAFALGPLVSRTFGPRMGVLLHRPDRADLVALGELMTSGEVRPVIDRMFALGDVADAVRYFGEGGFVGKVVVTIPGSDQ